MSKELPPNQQRHRNNLSSPVGLHGQFYKGIYYDHGVPQISKEKAEKIKARLEERGTIFDRKRQENPPVLIVGSLNGGSPPCSLPPAPGLESLETEVGIETTEEPLHIIYPKSPSLP